MKTFVSLCGRLKLKSFIYVNTLLNRSCCTNGVGACLERWTEPYMFYTICSNSICSVHPRI